MVVSSVRLAHDDALYDHLKTTLRMTWCAPPAHIQGVLPVCGDDAAVCGCPHASLVASLDRPPEVHAQYLRALEMVVHGVRAGRDISWPWMVEVQSCVLGVEDVAFRTTDAFCHEGRHRYIWFEGVEDLFLRKIRQDIADVRTHPLIKGIRLYLDLLFFHPFHDGNARAARLWFDAVMMQSGWRAPTFRELMRLPVLVGDHARYWSMVKYSAQLLTQMPVDGKDSYEHDV